MQSTHWRRFEFSFGGNSPGFGDGNPPAGSPIQKLKQFADIVHRFWPQKRSKSENFAQFTSWFLTNMFHGGGARPSNPYVASLLHVTHHTQQQQRVYWRHHHGDGSKEYLLNDNLNLLLELWIITDKAAFIFYWTQYTIRQKRLGSLHWQRIPDWWWKE